MQKGGIPRNAMIGVAVLGLGFWAGRAASSQASTPAEKAQRSSSRGNERAPVRVVNRGDGANPVESAQALRDLFKPGGGMSAEARAKEALSHMTTEQIAVLGRDLIASQALTSGLVYYTEITATFNRWAELDPDAALEFALATKQRVAQRGALIAVLSTMVDLDPVQTRQKIEAIADKEARRLAQSIALNTIAVSDPDTWTAWVKEYPSMGNPWDLSRVVSEWAIDDPAATAARLKALPPKMVEKSLEPLATTWAGKDPVAARAWAESLENPTQRATALSAVIGGMAVKDPDAAFAAMNALPPEDRAKALPEIFGALAGLDLESTLDRIRTLQTPEDKDLALNQLIQKNELQSMEPTKLVGLLEDLPEGESRSALLAQIGRLAGGSTAAEMEQTLAAFSEADQTMIRERMVESLGYRDPEKALSLLAGMKDSKSKVQQTAQAIGYLAAADPAAAISRLDELPPGEQRRSALSSIAVQWANKDEAGVITWAAGLQGEERISALRSLVPQLGYKNPTQAIKAFDQLVKVHDGSNESKQQISNTAMNLASTWVRKDPESAVKWAANLDAENGRSLVLQSALSGWRQSDPKAARQAVENLDVPAAEREKLLNQFKEKED